MNKKTLLIITLILFFTTLVNAHRVYIIIHGTWADNSDWSKPGGDFYESLKKHSNEDDSVTSFRWSGTNSFSARKRAAIRLAELIASYPQGTSIIVIGHSHGGNIAMHASELLAKYKNHPGIWILYTLGTPITNYYQPDMNVIEYVYNLFSFEDLVQPVMGGCHREFTPRDRVANLSVVVNGKEPDHSRLHCSEIAAWIPYLHGFLKYKENINSKPGRLYFYTDKNPEYEVDTQHQCRVERDIDLLKLCVYSLFPPIPEWRNVNISPY